MLSALKLIANEAGESNVQHDIDFTFVCVVAEGVEVSPGKKRCRQEIFEM
jgi:hypothetical protein